MNERERIELLAACFGPAPEGVNVGIGDDAAVLAAAPGSLVWTIDAQVEGTHFRADWVSWEDIGWRSFMAATSDLAAMGAEPVGVLSALVLAPSIDDETLAAIARGQAAAARATGAPVVGGNLARGAETSITTTALGRARQPVLRSGARAGDRLLVAGALGYAAAGLAALIAGMDVHDARISPCLAAWRRPRALLERGRSLGDAAVRGHAHAAIDISDGLACDALHLADASNVTLVFDADALRSHAGADLATAAEWLGRDVLDLVLHGGEDYALLVASDALIEGFTEVGVVRANADANVDQEPSTHAKVPRVLLKNTSGTSVTTSVVDPRGFDHFA